jgi:hypothetical protein
VKPATTTPALVSDLTAPAVLGLPNRRAFVPFVTALGVTPLKIGRRWFCRLDSILAAIDARTGSTAPAAAWSADDVVRRAAGGGK